MAEKKKLDWNPVDTDTFTGELKKQYEAWQEQQAIAKDLREEMEQTLSQIMFDQGLTPAGKEPVFGYRWGKMSCAFDDPSEPKTDTISLAS